MLSLVDSLGLSSDHRSVTQALSKDYHNKMNSASTSQSLKTMTRQWLLNAMMKSSSAKDGVERTLSSYRRSLSNDQQKICNDLRILGDRNQHKSLIITFGTFTNSSRQDILIGSSDPVIDHYFMRFLRQNTSALACSLQSFAK